MILPQVHKGARMNTHSKRNQTPERMKEKKVYDDAAKVSRKLGAQGSVREKQRARCAKEEQSKTLEGPSDSDPVGIQDEPRMEFKKHLGSRGNPL